MSPKKEDPLESYGKRVFVYLITLLFDFFNSHASPSNQLWGEDMYLLIASIFTFSIIMSTSAKFLILLIIEYTSLSVISEPGAYHQTAVCTFSYLKNHSVDILQTSPSHILSSSFIPLFVLSFQNLGLIIRLLNTLSLSLSINLSIALKLFFSLLDMILLLFFSPFSSDVHHSCP